ncbi:MAG: tRNA (guanosine(46)-N7)-methyltransferase TrmB [Pseudomonadota bacterium]
MDQHRPIRTFGRTGGRSLSARQQALMDDVLPGLSVPVAGGDQDLDPRAFFSPSPAEIWLEIGFGGGEHFTGQAARHPDVGFIGCEPFIEGMAKCLSQIEDARLANIRLLMDDARPLTKILAANSLDRVFILFPDPWPKKRQQKRRLIQADFLDDLARSLKSGGRLRFATDIASYADEALSRILHHGCFAWMAEHPDHWRVPPADHITTRYQEKRLGDCEPVWFEFARR